MTFPQVKPTILSRFSLKWLHEEPEAKALESLDAFGGGICHSSYLMAAVCNSEQVSVLRNTVVLKAVCAQIKKRPSLIVL